MPAGDADNANEDVLRRVHQIGVFELTVEQRAGPTRTYRVTDLPRVEACACQSCQGGGLDLHAAVRCLDPGEHYFYCLGYIRDGTIRRPCDNHFRIVLKPRHA